MTTFVDATAGSPGAPADGRRLRLVVGRDHATVVCQVRRAAGAGAALALADRVAALFRGRIVGPVRFGAPSIDLDGRDPGGFRAVVTLPYRHERVARRPPNLLRRPP